MHDLWEEKTVLWADRESLIHEDLGTPKVEQYAYARVDRKMKAATSVFASLGVETSDRVDLHMYSRPELIECFPALATIGAVVVPIGPTSTAAEYAFVVEEHGVCMFAGEFPKGSGRLGGITVVCLDGRSYEVTKIDRAGAPPPRPEVRPGDLLGVVYTLSTTPYPEGMVFTHASTVFSGKYVAWELSLSETDRCLTTMSIMHANLQLSAFMSAVYIGAAPVLMCRYSTSRTWLQVRRHGATATQAMVMIVKTLMAQLVTPGECDHSMKVVHYFLPLPKRTEEASEERYGTRLFSNYGSSEALTGVVADLPDGWSKWPSIGLAGPGYDVRIAGENSSALPPGGYGEIQVRGQANASLMAGYWRDEEITRVVFTADGWFHTEDCGCADADDWLYFVDCIGDIAKHTGESIPTCGVEIAILEHLGVAGVTMLGISDSIRGEAVEMVVVPRPGHRLVAEDVQDSPSLCLLFFRVPSVVEFRNGLPRGRYGGVLRNQLKIEESTVQKGNPMTVGTDVVGQIFGLFVHGYTFHDLGLFVLGYDTGVNGRSGLGYLNEHDERDPRLKILPMLGAMLIVDSKVTWTTGCRYNYAGLLHWGFGICFCRPTVRMSGRLETKVKLKDLYDRGEGKGLLAQHIDDAYNPEGNLLLTNESWSCLIYNGGRGSPKPSKGIIDMPNRPANVETTETIPESQALVCRLSGGYHPQHIDWEYATANGELRPILHATGCAGVTMRRAVDASIPGEPERITRFKTCTVSPAHPGLTLTMRLWKVTDGELHFVLIDADTDEAGTEPHLSWGIIRYK